MEVCMAKDERDLLEVLKSELLFLRKGGYARLPRAPWSFPLIFEDSPTCMNYFTRMDRPPCSECLLMQFVPPESQAEKVPCRHIILGACGQTLETLYACCTQQEIKEALETWLRTTIHRLEQDHLEEERASENVHAVAI